MTKFNKQKSTHEKLSERTDATVNEERGLAFEPSVHQEFYQRVATWLVGEPTFYGGEVDEQTTTSIEFLLGSLAHNDPEFFLRMASYARNELYLRSAPVYLLALACRHESTRKLIPRFAPDIIQRADELTEVLAAYSSLNQGKNVPRQLRKGLDISLRKFDEYALAKYDRKGDWSFRDMLRVVRPKPDNDAQRELWGRAVKGELTVPDTWEVALSTKQASKETWEGIIPKMGYMALLRNLRNFLKHKVNIDPVVERLIDSEQVARSRQFPYRFLSAYKAIGGDTGFAGYRSHTPTSVGDGDNNRLLEAIETALRLSVDNVPRLKGRTFVACDNSGSMSSSISERSEISCLEIANLMGSLAGGFCDRVTVAAFGDRVVPVQFSKHRSVFDNMVSINRADNGVSTEGWRIPQLLLDDDIDVDRVIVFTDMQMYERNYSYRVPYVGDLIVSASDRSGPRRQVQSLAGGITEYRRKVGHPVWLYLFNLRGYGTLQTPEDDPYTYNISGWSDKVFSWMNYAEQDPAIIIKQIKEYQYERPERREVKQKHGGSD